MKIYTKKDFEYIMTKSDGEMMINNMNLVYSVVHKFKGKSIPFNDLIAIGKLGLLSGIRSYDPNREGAENTRSVLFYNSIEGYIRNALNREGRRGFSIGKALCENPIFEDEACKSAVSATAKTLERSINRGVSLSQPILSKNGEDSDTTYGDVVTIDDIDDRYEERCALNKNVREIVKKYITNPNELKVLRMHFSGYYSSIAKIAAAWYSDNEDAHLRPEERRKGISYQSVQCYYDRAVEKLRNVKKSEFLFVTEHH